MVAKFLGHSKIDETLNTYSHMFQNKLTNIISIIDNLNDKAKNNNDVLEEDYNNDKDDFEISM